MITLALLSLISVEPETTLKMEGKPGIKVFGYCVSSDSAVEKKFEGVTPTEIHFDTNVQKCNISSSGDPSPVKFRVFQNRTFVAERELRAPISGIEIVIPLSKKKK